MKSNSKIFEDGMKDFYEKRLKPNIQKGMDAAGVRMVVQAFLDRGYKGFTGNLPTSLSFGLYIDYQLDSIFQLGDSLDPVIRTKIPRGYAITLNKPWEGHKRRIMGVSPIEDYEGMSLAEKLIRQHKPTSQFEIFVTTGAEYSEYQEKVEHHNVLTQTYLDTRNGLAYQDLLKNLKITY